MKLSNVARMKRYGSRCLVLLICALAGTAHASFLDGFKDPDDGQFDISEWLLDRNGFLPVPIVITEPAIGYGGGLAAVYFRQSIRDAAANKGPSGEVTPPSLFGAAIAGTSNGTKFGGLGGMFSFDGDRFRYRGGAAKASANLDFYGIGNSSVGQQLKIGYNLDGWGTMQQVLMRLGATDIWVSARWLFLDSSSTLKPTDTDVDLPEQSFAKQSSGLGPTIEYDSRDNIFTPNRGWTGSVDMTFYDSAWGSDNRFQSYRAHVFAYFPIGTTFVIGARLDERTARGDVPFYLFPFVDLRGIPAGRLQDQNTGVAETELRWNVTHRWALIAFAGAARAWGRVDDFGSATTSWAEGGGFRYLLARRLGLYMGIDYGRSQYDHAFYLQVGNAWR